MDAADEGDYTKELNELRLRPMGSKSSDKRSILIRVIPA